MAKIGEHFQTGQLCKEYGVYQFDGYLDGSADPLPSADERVIPIRNSEIFPPVRSANKACWWKLVGIADQS